MSISPTEQTKTYDVIVVGGGSAGCLVAGRLAVETDAEVLLEDGGRDSNPLIHIPGGFAKLLEYGRFLYPYETVPQQALDGRQISLQQGRGLGGGSSINAMAYVRGQARDYDNWATAAGGSDEWSFDDLLPHFVGMEGNDILSAPWHGAEGPLKISQPVELSPINHAIIKAFQEHGLPYNADYNGAEQRGVGPCQLNMNAARRCSSADAFLHPAEGRPNLTVMTDALVTRVVLDGDQAIGVEFVHHGQTRRALAAETVLSAGAINTPRVLMLSGIGPEAELARHGIALLVLAPEVGRNLQDHPQTSVIGRTHSDLGYAADAHGLGMVEAGIQYITTKSGPAASNGIESVCYFDPEDLTGDPTIQCFHSAVMTNAALGGADKQPGFSLATVVLQPKSRGQVTLRNADPRSAPLIDPNYLAHPDDMRSMIAGVRCVRAVLDAPSLRDVVEAEVSPGVSAQSDAELTDHIKKTITCMWHPIGTARMSSDEQSVVDPALRVRGVRGLRVIDASIMPNIISGNTNATTLALASKGLGFLKAALGG